MKLRLSRQAPVIYVMVPPGAWSMALMLWLPFELLLLPMVCDILMLTNSDIYTHTHRNANGDVEALHPIIYTYSKSSPMAAAGP